MFGYIKPFKLEMKVRHLDTYQAVYCGLCKQLGTHYGRCSNAALSFDFTFVSLLGMAVNNECAGFVQKRCGWCGFKKKNCCQNNPSSSFAAACAMIMLYFKIRDNISDSSVLKKILYYCLLPISKKYMKKARSQYPDAYEIIQAAVLKQTQLQKENCSIPDQAADPSATALAKLFPMLTGQEKQKPVLAQLGYHLGRYVYFCDALEDLEADWKENNYNPFLLKFQVSVLDTSVKEHISEYAKGLIQMTVGEAAKAFCLLDMYRFEPILSNIIYLGLPNTLEGILHKEKEKKKNGQSL